MKRLGCGADLVPVLVALIQEHRGAAARDALAHTLFNLVKRPTPGQRRMVLAAWRGLAAAIGPARTAEELLPQCWEQVRRSEMLYVCMITVVTLSARRRGAAAAVL